MQSLALWSSWTQEDSNLPRRPRCSAGVLPLNYASVDREGIGPSATCLQSMSAPQCAARKRHLDAVAHQ